MNSNSNSWGGMLQSVTSKLKAAYLNVSDTELKVLEATNEEPWGPHGSVMAEIARMAERSDQYNEIMGIIHQRLQERDEKWRLCYKALLLLEYLCKQGPLRVASDLARSVHMLESLRDMFEYKDPQGRDHGINVRQRAKELVMLVNSPQKLQEEREKAVKNSGKYKGVSADDMRVGGYGSGGGGGGGGASGGGSSSSYSTSQGYGSTAGYGSGSRDMSGNRGSEASNYGRLGSQQPAEKKVDDNDDPFEATRKRIERLKADGAVAEPPRDPPAMGISGTLVDPVADQKKGPKKLSDVKVDPKFASTFAGMAPAPARPAAVLSLPPPPGMNKAGGSRVVIKPPSAPASSTALDLLGDLDVPALPTAAAPAPALPARTSGLAPPTGTFGGPAFPVAAPAQRQPAAADGFDMLAGAGPGPAQPAAAPAAAKPSPSPLDDIFGPMPAAPAAFSTPQAAASSHANDPFATLAAAAAPPTMLQAPTAGTGMLLQPPAASAVRPALDDFFAAPSSSFAAPSSSFVAPVGSYTSVSKPATVQHQPMSAPPPPPPASLDPFAGLGF